MLIDETKKKRLASVQPKKTLTEAELQKQQEKEGERKIAAEITHLAEEAQTRSLGRAALSDLAGNRPSLTASCQNFFNHCQGI